MKYSNIILWALMGIVFTIIISIQPTASLAQEVSETIQDMRFYTVTFYSGGHVIECNQYPSEPMGLAEHAQAIGANMYYFAQSSFNGGGQGNTYSPKGELLSSVPLSFAPFECQGAWASETDPDMTDGSTSTIWVNYTPSGAVTQCQANEPIVPEGSDIVCQVGVLSASCSDNQGNSQPIPPYLTAPHLRSCKNLEPQHRLPLYMDDLATPGADLCSIKGTYPSGAQDLPCDDSAGFLQINLSGMNAVSDRYCIPGVHEENPNCIYVIYPFANWLPDGTLEMYVHRLGASWTETWTMSLQQNAMLGNAEVCKLEVTVMTPDNPLGYVDSSGGCTYRMSTIEGLPEGTLWTVGYQTTIGEQRLTIYNPSTGEVIDILSPESQASYPAATLNGMSLVVLNTPGDRTAGPITLMPTN